MEFQNISLRKDLDPILEMLTAKGKSLSKEKWRDLVNTTRNRIVNNPEQYLSEFKESSEGLAKAIDILFEERLN